MTWSKATVDSQTAEGRGKQPVVNLIIVAAEQHIERIARGQWNGQRSAVKVSFSPKRSEFACPQADWYSPNPGRHGRFAPLNTRVFPAVPRSRRPFRQFCNMLAAERAFRQRYQELHIAGFRAVGVVDDALGWASEFSRRQSCFRQG